MAALMRHVWTPYKCSIYHELIMEKMVLKILKSLLILTPFLIGINCSFANSQNSREIAEKTLPSVVLIIMEDTKGRTISLGSGFLIGEGIVATNYHVIKTGAKGFAKLFSQDAKYDIDGLISFDSKMDLALLSIKNIKGHRLSLGDCSKIKIGDEIYVAGNPLGLEGTFSQGMISGIRKIGKDYIFQITAPISPGSSGGPVLNRHGDVIGVAVGTVKDGQNINFAIPSSYLASLLLQKKPIMQFPQKSDLGRIEKPAKGNIRGETWFPVIGSFKSIDDAKKFLEKMRGINIPYQIELYLSDTGYYAVTLGGYLDRDEANRRVVYARGQGIALDAYLRNSTQWGNNLLKDR